MSDSLILKLKNIWKKIICKKIKRKYRCKKMLGL
jgi:hypothetical protein